jgi:thioredoxin-dependent peroxiredoxin
VEYRQRNAVILGVSFDNIASNKAFAEKFDFPYPLLCDTDRSIGVAYGAADDPNAMTARRISYLIDPYGNIKHVWPKVDVKIHADEVLTYMV